MPAGPIYGYGFIPSPGKMCPTVIDNIQPIESIGSGSVYVHEEDASSGKKKLAEIGTSANTKP